MVSNHGDIWRNRRGRHVAGHEEAALDGEPSVMVKHRDNAKQREKEDDDERDEAISRHTLLVAQRAQTLDPSGRQITHELRVGRGGPVEKVSKLTHEGGQVIFADSQLVVMFRGGQRLTCRGQRVAVNLFEDRFLEGGYHTGGRLGGRMVQSRALRYSGRTEPGLGLLSL